MTFKSTFNLPNLDFLLKGIKGNGMTLGLTDGTNNMGFYSSSQNGNAMVGYAANAYGTNTGTSQSEVAMLNRFHTLGVTTDPTKSGIETDISSSIKYVIKY